MNPLKVLVVAAFTVAVVSAQNATPTPTTVAPAGDDNITITPEQLQSILAEIKALAATDPDIADVFSTVDIDALAKLTPAQVRAALNDKVFDATAPPKPRNSSSSSSAGSSSGSGKGSGATVTSSPPSAEAVASKSPSVPGPAPKSGASLVQTATVTTLAAGVVITVFAM